MVRLLMTWLLSTLAAAPIVLTLFAYWRGLHVAAKLLPRERRANGDNRVVPDLYSPESSHRWFGVIVREKTGNYSPRLRRAISQARIAFVLFPVALTVSFILLEQVWKSSPQDAGADGYVVVFTQGQQ